MSTKHRRPLLYPAGALTLGQCTRLLLLHSVIFLVAPKATRAQPATPMDDGSYGDGSPSISPALAVLITIVVVVFFLFGIFALYLRRCTNWNSPIAPAGGDRRSSRLGHGLDPAVLETFPKLPYAEAKRLQIGKGDLDCAVCLSEFKDDDMLRMLPKCCHVFHPQCIDAWLGAHVTCPVCRANLDDPDAAVPNLAPAAAESADSEGQWPDRPAIAAGVAPDAMEMVQTGEQKERSAGYGRSHSVGFTEGSTVTMDRFTLRLPEHVRREIAASGRLQREIACPATTAPGEGRLRRAASLGDSGVAVRGGASGWGTFFRSFSWRRRAEGDAAAESSIKRVHTPSGSPLNCFVGGGSVRENSEPEKDEKEPSPWV